METLVLNIHTTLSESVPKDWFLIECLIRVARIFFFNLRQFIILEAITLRYSLARSLCSSNISLDSLLLGSGGTGLRCGSSIRCIESYEFSSSSFGVVTFSVLKASLVTVAEFVTVFVLFTPVEDTVLVRASVVVSLSLPWLFAVKRRQKCMKLGCFY